MHGGVRNMKGEKQMIYKNITFVQAKQYFMKCLKI